MRFSNETTSPRVSRLPFGLYAKHGPFITVTEAFATQYVSVNTSIPVPSVLDVLVDSRGPFILMTRVPGKSFPQMPRNANQLTERELEVFSASIRNWLTQLRSLGPPPSGQAVSGFMGTPFLSYRIDHCNYVGPFASPEEFHAQYFCTLPPEADPEIRALAERIRKKPYRVYFTHGDLAPNNVLVDENYVPVGLIDFDCAAWMPEYWDMTTSIYIRQRYTGWVRILTSALPGYEDELAVEMEQWKYICPY
ncbi:kinase-like protein [Gloeophyllum trabeum ATCC 11539]|uniref:Kinase-like protein n=1 Tax=Gloeophyllum trabeum (strain ATCC 11539 / FP-39264 / Madison 617) TaxID=670483 RepID=S7RG80_GLOTA|nr:kinase-like protein [Gloeophyllum trabeum ATCC 11539]EPQ53240.1 kinase-like protein [Gloeophyllum trabeum ATCC 11539]